MKGTKVTLTDSEKLWFRLNFPHMRNGLIAIKFGIGIRTVVRIARSMGLEKTPQFMRETQAFTARKAAESNSRLLKGRYTPNLQKGERYRFTAGRKVWSEELDRKVIELYPSHPASRIAGILGFTRSAVTNRCHVLGLRKRKRHETDNRI